MYLQAAAKLLERMRTSQPLSGLLNLFKRASRLPEKYCDSRAAKLVQSEKFQCIKAIIEK